jgi:curli biogenesis system outer membrane secretion channel CsgG
MKRIRALRITIALALMAASAGPTLAQGPAAIQTDKPAIMVMGFESGTVTAQVRDKQGFGSILAGMGGVRGGENYEPSQLGVGIADMLVDKLLETSQFRLLERNPAEPGKGAQFIVTGSVTKFGFEEHNYGGIAASVATMGLLNYKQHKTEVTLTARVINAATGEIVASVSGAGVSKKGGGLRVAGIGSNGFGGGDASTSNFRATAIGEATERAVADLAAKIIERKSTF